MPGFYFTIYDANYCQLKAFCLCVATETCINDKLLCNNTDNWVISKPSRIIRQTIKQGWTAVYMNW